MNRRGAQIARVTARSVSEPRNLDFARLPVLRRGSTRSLEARLRRQQRQLWVWQTCTVALGYLLAAAATALWLG